MPIIYDNIEKKLEEGLNHALEVSHRSDFCVGYFNLRGWRKIASNIDKWSGEEFYIKAEIEADEIEVLESLNKLILDKEKTEQLIVANNRIDDALKKIDKLNKKLEEVKDLKFDNHIIKEYQNSIDEISSNELFQNGIKAANEGKYDDSILLNLKALELNPNFSDAMFNIGHAYNEKGDSDLAIEYWNKTIELNPSYIRYVSRKMSLNLIFSFVQKNRLNSVPVFSGFINPS